MNSGMSKNQLDNATRNTIDLIRKEAYRTIKPSSFDDLNNVARWISGRARKDYDDPRSEDAWAFYLKQKEKSDYLTPSKYKPSISKNPTAKYYNVDPELEQAIFDSFKDRVKLNEVSLVDEFDLNSRYTEEELEGIPHVNVGLTDRNTTGSKARMLGNFSVSKGHDKKGDYLSYHDVYDFPEYIQHELKGEPFNIYGRVYYPNNKKQVGGIIEDPMGQWKYPGQVTRIPSSNITMQGVDYPVYGVDNNGQEQMMYPGQEYNFPGADYVDEYPMMKDGGLLSKSVTCSNCGWSWKGVKGGLDALTCHKCGGTIKMKNGGEIEGYQVGGERSFLETASQFIPGYETYLDLRDIVEGAFKGDRAQMNQGVIGLGQPFSGKALTNTLDYVTEKLGGKSLADQLSDKRSDIVNMSEREKIELFKRYGMGGYDQWIKAGKPKLKNGGGLLSRSVSCSNCGHSWAAVDGGKDPLTCHNCGGMVMMKSGGQHGGLDRWFAEKWVDVKTGKDCGRQEGENREGYPACRPSKRINADTPKTLSELSSAEKAKFKQEKTSSERINYNHKKQMGGDIPYNTMENFYEMKEGGNVPTNPSLWSKAKSVAKSKYDVYPSAYANGFAAKWYKERGGNWKKAQMGMQVPKKTDSTFENILEVFDPTGLSSWDDVYRSYQETGFSPETTLEILGALPLLGKAGKALKAASYLGKGIDGYIYSKKLGNAAKVVKGAGLVGRASDAAQTIEQAPNNRFFPFKEGGTNNSGFEALPKVVQAKILSNMGYGGYYNPMMANGGEPDGEMALGQIDAAINKLTNLRKFIQPDSDLEPWVSSKLTMVDDYANSVSDYIMYNPETQEMMELPLEEMKNGGIPERYKNMGFTKVGTKKQSTRPGKKWMVLAKKGDAYKVVHGGYKGMQDFKQHHSEQRRKNFWNRMGGKNSSKATDPFSPLYWHKRFGTWENGGQINQMQNGGIMMRDLQYPVYGMDRDLFNSRLQNGGNVNWLDNIN
jgi:DNA-directed RNA polymerase subunit RPC12/RpoP